MLTDGELWSCVQLLVAGNTSFLRQHDVTLDSLLRRKAPFFGRFHQLLQANRTPFLLGKVHGMFQAAEDLMLRVDGPQMPMWEQAQTRNLDNGPHVSSPSAQALPTSPRSDDLGESPPYSDEGESM